MEVYFLEAGIIRFAGKSERVQANGQKTHTVNFMDDEKNKLTLRVTPREYVDLSACGENGAGGGVSTHIYW